MRSKILLWSLIITLFNVVNIQAQSHLTQEFIGLNAATEVQTVPIIERDSDVRFTTFYIELSGDNIAHKTANEIAIEYRIPTSIGSGVWKSFIYDPHVNDRPDYWMSHFVVLPGSREADHIQLKINNTEYKSVQFHQFNPYSDGVERSESSDNSDLRTDCDCPEPSKSSREQWCDGGCPKNYTPVITDVTHLIIHHSAGTNNSNDWAAIVESYWDFHVNGRGWDDIGYNWLIDPNGVIYTGRGNDVQGAHFCGQNSGTAGICMIGTYIDVLPTIQAREALYELLAWKTCDKSIDPKGRTYFPQAMRDLYNITGHKSDCATTCPGDDLYDYLPQIRENTDRKIQECGNISPEIILSAVYNPDRQFTELEWEFSGDADGSFTVLSRKSGESFTELDSLESQSREYVHDNLDFASTYFYQINYSEGDSVEITSNIVSVKTPDFDKPKLYPNIINTNSVKIELRNPESKIYNIAVYDAAGKRLYSDRFLALENLYIYNIDVTGYSAGNYFVDMYNEEEDYTFRFIKVE